MVADATGLHPSTVSRILTGAGARTSADTRRRVLETAERLGYQPNLAARSLRTRRSLTIGLVIPDLTDPVFAQLHLGAEAAARRSGYHVLLSTVDAAAIPCASDLDYLTARGVDGVLLATAKPEDPLLDRLRALRMPYVLVNRVAGADHPHVANDEELGGRLVTRHLLELGHRRFGFVGGMPGASTADGRLAGFRAALAEAGVDLDERRVVVGAFGPRHAIAATEAILDVGEAGERPTAIVVVDDLMAIAARRVLADRGLRVPLDVSVTGYNDLPLAALVEPALTTVRTDLDGMGQAAALALLRVVGGEPVPESVLRAPSLVVRASTAPPAGATPRL
jgi:LacI family transcriptional regulator